MNLFFMLYEQGHSLKTLGMRKFVYQQYAQRSGGKHICVYPNIPRNLNTLWANLVAGTPLGECSASCVLAD